MWCTHNIPVAKKANPVNIKRFQIYMQARENKKKHARTPKLDSASLLKPEITQTEPVDLTAQQTKRRQEED